MKPQDATGLLKKLDVKTFDEIGEGKAKEILVKLQAGEISKEEWDYLKTVVPRFADVVSVGLTTVGSVFSAAASVQAAALKIIHEGISAAKEIAAKSDDPEVHKEALRLIDSALERVERMNKENNAFNGKALGIVAGVIGVAAYVLTGGKIGPKTIA